MCVNKLHKRSLVKFVDATSGSLQHQVSPQLQTHLTERERENSDIYNKKKIKFVCSFSLYHVNKYIPLLLTYIIISFVVSSTEIKSQKPRA